MAVGYHRGAVSDEETNLQRRNVLPAVSLPARSGDGGTGQYYHGTRRYYHGLVSVTMVKSAVQTTVTLV